MKYPKGLVVCAILLSSTSVFALRLSEPVQQDLNTETFGAAIEEMPERVSIGDLIETPNKFTGQILSVEATVNKVCQKKGCFFIAQQGNQLIRVAFKDYRFFVPTDIGGQKVILVGELITQRISAGQAQHLNKDLGEVAAVKSGLVSEIVASSVRIPE